MVPIIVSQLTKRFGDALAVDGVDLSIAAGELFFLLGPSGCGKTTLLRCIAGFAEIDGGTIHFGNRDISRLPPHRRNTGMVFQNYALWPHMTVAENVAFGLRQRRVSSADRSRRVAAALDRVQMGALAHRKPNQLSGGQQQRVALARAMVIEPECLLLDEPLSNLDAQLRLEMREQIRDLCKRAGITAVYVTHDQKEALSIADRLAVLDKGRVRQIGPPREVYRSPADRFVAGFIGETNLLPGRVLSHENGAITVDVGFASITGRGVGRALAAGAAVMVSMRPESIRLGPAPAGRTALPCRIEHSVYLGELAQHRVQLGPGVVVRVFEMNPRHVAVEGQPVMTTWWADLEDVVVLE